MRKILLSLFLIVAINVYSQPEFKISVEGFEWSGSPSSLSADLQINLKIKNVGNKTGECSDFKGIWLYSSSESANNYIKYKKQGTFLFKKLKPNDYITSFLVFSVPVDTDNLELRFGPEYGGASKFITNSYNKYISEKTDDKTTTLLQEAESLFNNGSYDKAITKYILCIKYDPFLMSELNLKISECYVKKGDAFYSNFYSNNNNFNYIINAIDNYRLSLDYNKNSEITNIIASLYDLLGNNEYDNGKYQGALTNYEKSLEFAESQNIKDKIALIKRMRVTYKSKDKNKNNSNKDYDSSESRSKKPVAK